MKSYTLRPDTLTLNFNFTHGFLFPFMSILNSNGYKSMIGLVRETMSSRYESGRKLLLPGGRHPISCWNGLNGLPVEKLIAAPRLGSSVRSEHMGA